MSGYVQDITFEAGSLVVTKEGRETRHDIASVLRAADIPADLNITSLSLLTKLANLFEILLKDLLNREVISEEFYAEYDLDHFLEILTNELATDIGD